MGDIPAFDYRCINVSIRVIVGTFDVNLSNQVDEINLMHRDERLFLGVRGILQVRLTEHLGE